MGESVKYLIGDVHGYFVEYADILDELTGPSIQLGDMGIGFKRDHLYPQRREHRFIRGNHDNPAKCREYPTYLGDFGWLEQGKVFFIGGGWSIDGGLRTKGVSWWPEEEFTYQQWELIADMYEQTKPKIVLTHDCPHVAYPEVGVRYPKRNTTSSSFDMLLKIHKPKLWVFGHHHKSLDFEIDDVQYIALGELEVRDVEF